MINLCIIWAYWLHMHWIQVDLGSSLSIIPKRLFYYLGFSLNRLSTTTTTIYGFNTESSHPLGKCHIPLPKIHKNGVAMRVSDVYTRGEYPHIHAKLKVT